MKRYKFFFLFSLYFIFGCQNGVKKHNLKGEWRSKEGETILKFTNKEFISDNGSPISEDYFIKGDTLFTSYEGNYPYTPFVIKELRDNDLTLIFPDSIAVEFTRIK
jgi:hypothetical protein